MKKRREMRELISQLLSGILFWVFVFAVYKGVGYVRGQTLHRVYRKADSNNMVAILAKDWSIEAESVDERLYEMNWSDQTKPYVVVLIDDIGYAYKSENWTVIACSGKKDLSDMKTVIFCRYYTKTAGYGSSPTQNRASSTGTSEFVSISYVDAESHKQYYWESFGKELPGSTSKTPHYKVSRNKLLSHIKKRLKKGPEWS